jgi:hypothetical protein
LWNLTPPEYLDFDEQVIAQAQSSADAACVPFQKEYIRKDGSQPAEEYHTVYHCTDAAGNRIPNEQMPGVRVARGESLVGLEVDWHTSKGIYSLLIYSDALPAIHGYPITCIMTFQDVTKLLKLFMVIR